MTRLFKMILITVLSVGIIMALFYFRDTENFDFGMYDADEAYQIAEVLTSEELLGRGSGEPGNELTVEYITHFLEENDVEYEAQYFTQLTPIIDPYGTIRIGDQTYELFEEFEFSISGAGSGVQFEGDILYVGESIFDIDPGLLKDRIIVFRSNRITEEHEQYLIENGAKGLMYYTNNEYYTTVLDRELMNRKYLYIDDKTSSEIFKGVINYDLVQTIREIARNDQYEEYYRPAADAGVHSNERMIGLVHDVTIDTHVDYQLIDMPNIIITIPGKDRTISNNFISRFDGQGLGNDEIKYFPSAVNGGASSAALLELAKALNSQTHVPDEDINIVLVNASSVSSKSFTEVLELLEDRYEGNKNIAIEYIGYKGSKGAYIDWDYFNNQAVVIGNKLYGYSGDLGAVFEFVDEPIIDFSYYLSYSKHDNPFVMITGTQKAYSMSKLADSSDDSFDQVSLESMDNAMKIVLGYVNKDLYNNMPLNFIDIRILYGLTALTVMGLIVMMIHEGYLITRNETLEQIYYSRVYSLVAMVFKYTIPFGIALLLIGMVLNIPSDFNLVKIGNSNLTNFSLYSVIKGTYFSILNIFRTIQEPSSLIMQKIVVYIRKSLLLISLGLFLSLVLGIFKGIMDSYSKKRNSNLKTLTSIFAYSVPDVLIAILSLLAIIYLSSIGWINDLIGPKLLRTTIMPVVALIIIPSIYISRLIFVTIEEEKQKEYVKFLYYKGIPRRQVYFRQFAFVSVMKVLASMKSILMVVFSNLILVEYIFSYPGIMYNIITYQNNPYVIIIFALVIGILFVAITGLSKFVLRIISPGREALS